MTASLDRVRLWTSFGALTGFSWLAGGAIEHVSPERWWIFTRALPVYGRCARPLDLLAGDPPRFWLLEIPAVGGHLAVLGVFNWSTRPWSTRVRLSDLGIEAEAPHLFFNFWEQRLSGPGGMIHIELPPCSCAVWFVSKMQDAPTWVGTDRHVTGAIGLESLSYDPSTGIVSGRCVGPPHTGQRHYLYLPELLAPVSSRDASFEVPQHRLMKVSVKLDGSGRRDWTVRLLQERGVL